MRHFPKGPCSYLLFCRVMLRINQALFWVLETEVVTERTAKYLVAS